MSTKERPYPLRGEIWWTHFPGEPAEKIRPAIVVSGDSRNSHPRALTVLVIPLSTSTHKLSPFHLALSAGESGLREDSVAWAENISAIPKDRLAGPVAGHRRVTHTQICRLSGLVKLAMGCPD